MDNFDLPEISPQGETSTQNLGGEDYNGLCEKYAEEKTYGHANLFPTAADAWNSYIDNGNAYTGTKGMKKGDLVYFTPDSSNQGFGHVGIYEGDGEFTSATYNGVKKMSLDEWQKNTGQQLLGHVRPSQEPVKGNASSSLFDAFGF